MSDDGVPDMPKTNCPCPAPAGARAVARICTGTRLDSWMPLTIAGSEMNVPPGVFQITLMTPVALPPTAMSQQSMTYAVPAVTGVLVPVKAVGATEPLPDTDTCQGLPGSDGSAGS